MSDTNQRIAELIGDEATVSHYVLTSTGGTSCSDRCEPHEIGGFKEYYASRIKPGEEILPVMGYRPYDKDLNEAFRAVAIAFGDSKIKIELESGDGRWYATISRAIGSSNAWESGATCQGDTPALAICAAMLG